MAAPFSDRLKAFLPACLSFMRKIRNGILGLSVETKDLNYKLTLIFGLFFLFPIIGFGFFAVKYDIIHDEFLSFFFIAVLLAYLFGYNLMRRIIDEIRAASQSISDNLPTEMCTVDLPAEANELHQIVQSFRALDNELRSSFSKLDHKLSQMLTLKELADLCYVTFDKDDLFHITLERALKLVSADAGSILLIESSERQAFIVQANIGLGDILQKGDRVDFKESIAKFAVINNSPILVDDIENDSRFGRMGRPRYGTKSFLCMPLKGSSEVFGVLTLSRRIGDETFTQDDVTVLASLLSNAAFTYENQILTHRDKERKHYLAVVEDIFKTINSSLRGPEFFKAILGEVQKLIPFDMAAILMRDAASDAVTVLDFAASIPFDMEKNRSYPYKGSIIDRVIQQETAFIASFDETAHPLERDLFVRQKLRSGLLTPLKLDGRIMAVLILGSQNEDHFADYRGQALQLAQILPLAIEKNRLVTSMVKRDQEMKSIKQIGSMLASSTFEMDEVLRNTMEMIQTLMNVEAGSLLLLEEDELSFKVAFNSRITVELLETLRIKLGQGIAGYTAACGESLIVNDTKESHHFSQHFDAQTNFETRTVLCVPLISHGKVQGVLEVLNKENGDFDENDRQLLQSIATSVSIALENSRLYHETVYMAEHERSIRKMFQKFVPKEVVDSITGDASARPVFEELKTLTFLNIDIRGFSVLTRNIGPKKTVALLNHFFSVMGDIVFRHHGIVDKYLGDGFLAVFGAPVSSIVDADNAIAAALDMKEAMVKISEDVAQEFEVGLAMGISIHTGEAVVGNIGFEKKMDYTVIGDSVNVVFRLQDMTKAWPNSILLSEHTRQATVQSYLELQEIAVPDNVRIESDIKIYELLGLKNREPKPLLHVQTAL